MVGGLDPYLVEELESEIRIDYREEQSAQITKLLQDKYEKLLLEGGVSLEVFADLDLVEKFTLIEDLQRNQRDKKHDTFI